MAQVANEASKETIDSYVTDMLALEKHIQTVLAGQIEDLDEHSEVKGPLIKLHEVCERHARDLEALTVRREQNVGGMSKVVKKAVSSVLGLGAAAVDFVRTEKLPKDLRDDYTALSLAYIGYVMLHSSALSLNDHEVAELARTHFRNHAQNMMALQQIIPAATVALLAEKGLEPSTSVLPTISDSVRSAWR